MVKTQSEGLLIIITDVHSVSGTYMDFVSSPVGALLVIAGLVMLVTRIPAWARTLQEGNAS